MKKTLFGLILALALVMPITANAAENTAPAVKPANPIDQFTGEYWVKTVEGSKLAYLFGIDSAVAVEDLINTRLAEKNGKKHVSNLSPFEKGWMQAFKNMTRKEIAQAVDQWYAANPDKLNRPVMDVLWYEVIVPRLGK